MTTEVYARLLEVTGKHLSEPSVRAAVDTVLNQRGLAPQDLTIAVLPEVIADAMVGLRIFCDPAKFGELMMDLTELCEALQE